MVHVQTIWGQLEKQYIPLILLAMSSYLVWFMLVVLVTVTGSLALMYRAAHHEAELEDVAMGV